MILNSELKLDIPGTGFALSLNPTGGTGTTAIPISLTTHWGIKKYIKNFNLQSFSYSPEKFLELSFQIFNLNDKGLIATTAINFESSATPLDDLANALISNWNLTNLTLPLSTDFETAINEIYTAAQNSPSFNLKAAIASEYIIGATVDDTFDNIEKLFSLVTGGNTIEKLKELFIPKISARLVLTAGLEFPRSVLVPVDIDQNPEPTGNTTLLFAESEFTFSTNGGIGFDTDITLNLTPALSQIGNTGLLIGFSGAKLDFSRNTNIAEATADGRPNEFISLYSKR